MGGIVARPRRQTTHEKGGLPGPPFLIAGRADARRRTMLRVVRAPHQRL
jgi:hypothetical protein